MNRHSIKFKMTLLLSIVIGLLIIILLLANSFFAEKYYLYDKRQQMLTGYDKINEIMKMYDGSDLSRDNLYDKMEQYTSNTAMPIIIVSSDWTTVYTNTSSEVEMLDRLKMSIFNKDMFHFGDKIEGQDEDKTSNLDESDTQNEEDLKDDIPHDGIDIEGEGYRGKKKDPYKNNITFDMEISGI